MQVQSDLDHAGERQTPFLLAILHRKVADTGQYPRKGRQHSRKTANSWYPASTAIPAAHPGHVSAVGKIDAVSERPARVERTRYEDVGHGIQVPVRKSPGPQDPKLIAQTVIIASSPGQHLFWCNSST